MVFSGAAFLIILIVILGISLTGSKTEKNKPDTVESDSLGQMEIAFEGGYKRQEIQRCVDTALTAYGHPLTEENYSRAGSALVGLRKQLGVPEMSILAYMIRSHVPGVQMTFPDAAGIAATAIKTGERAGSCP